MSYTPPNPGWARSLYLRFAYPFLTLNPRLDWGTFGRMQYYWSRECLSVEENRRLQWEALSRLLVHAYETSPFYRRRFDSAGIHPREIASPTDLPMIPVLTREEIREHLEDIWSRNFKREELQQSYTGGTTTAPVPFLRNWSSVKQKIAVQQCLNSWAGWFQGDRVFYVWGAQQDFPENPSWRWRLQMHHILRQYYTPTSVLNEERLEARRKALNLFRPKIICAFPTPLTILCEYLRDAGRPYYRPEAVVCSAEPLLPHQRELMERVLGCPVFNHYGTREFGMIAGDCAAHSGLHFNPAAAYAEFLPIPESDEGLHEIVITDLLNYGMPLIRYRVNDCAVPAAEPCPCGMGFPLVQQIVGRTSDVFVLANGDKVPGVSLIRMAVGLGEKIGSLQIIQEDLEAFRVRFVPGPQFQEGDVRLLQDRLEQRIGKSVRWSFEKVDAIDRERSGKTRYCISKVTGASVRRESLDEAAKA